MGAIKTPSPVKLFAGIMFRGDFDLGAVMKVMRETYGPVEMSYGPIEFTWSNYYENEMGESLLKYYALFKNPVNRAALPNIKIHANLIEDGFAANGKRVVNIDPGYLTADKLVLASTKDFYHRLYIGNGIFAEATLHYRNKIGYRYFSWTYPDYQDPGFLGFLERARETVLAAIPPYTKNAPQAYPRGA